MIGFKFEQMTNFGTQLILTNNRPQYFVMITKPVMPKIISWNSEYDNRLSALLKLKKKRGIDP